ncbi:MAG: UDP-N-acetylmuramate dehydrogenase [Alistipes sp.]|nr:UDP-N-acetylmuramate dehydrogenase [Alistipes sp.]
MINEYFNHPLRELNSFHVEEMADHILEFDRAEDLDQIFGSENAPQKWYALGGGNNILFTRRFEGTLIKPTGTKIHILTDDEDSVLVSVEAGLEWDDMVEWAVEHELWGVENLSLIPGTIGASPVQNIGAYGAEAKDVIERVHFFDTSERTHKSLRREECRFAYRNSIFKGELKGRCIITSVEFRLKKRAQPNLAYGDLKAETEKRGDATLRNIRDAVCAIRRSKLPDTAILGNAGSFFKNPIVEREVAEQMRLKYENMPIYPTADSQKAKLAAGWLIDKCGLKGYRQGNVGVHERQALVLVNYGGANGNDVMSLAHDVCCKVAQKFGIDIEPEVNVL